MNKLNFSIPAGWPLSEETLEYMQNMILTAQNSALLGGKNYILSGCIEASGNVGNGIVVIDGEIVPFEGGPAQPKVIIVEEVINRNFFGGASNPYYHRRKAVFGTGIGEIDYSSLTRNNPDNGILARLDKVEKMLKPLMSYDVSGTTTWGSWLFWGRPAGEIPAGWEAVPDAEWKGRVPVVLDTSQTEFNTVGKIGGEKAHTLTGAEQGSNKFKIKLDDIGGGGDSVVAGMAVNGSDVPRNGGANQSSYGSELTIKPQNDAVAHNNLQPYKVVMFIRFVG